MNLRAALEATVGRRMLVRVWLFGMLLLGVIVLTVTAVDRVVIRPRMEANNASPGMLTVAAEHALEKHDDPAAMSKIANAIRERGHASITIYDADDKMLDSGKKVLPPPTAELRAAMESAPNHAAKTRCEGDVPCEAVGVYEGGKLVAYAVMTPPPPPGSFRHDAALVFAAVILLLAIASIPIARSITRPLDKLGAVVRELGRGDMNVRADAVRRDEVGDLARTFNEMAERIQKLRQAEKELLANVSHELRTPLARMRVVLELASDGDPSQVQRYLGEIGDDLSELEQLLEDVIASARLDALEGKVSNPHASMRNEHVDVEELALEVAERFRSRYGRKVVCNVPHAHAEIAADKGMIKRVLENLVENARKYSPEDKPITIAVETPADESRVRVAVIDEGIGISREDLPHVFTSFFRADKSRTRGTGGVGLGLSLARRIVEAHDGTIDLESELGRGTKIWFELARAYSRFYKPKARSFLCRPSRVMPSDLAAAVLLCWCSRRASMRSQRSSWSIISLSVPLVGRTRSSTPSI